MLYAVRTKSADMKQAVINDITSSDPNAKIHPEGNPVTFWVSTILGWQELLNTPGVLDIVSSQDTCPCGSGELKEALHDARGIFCCYVCPKCEQTQRAKYRTDVLENSDYVANEEIEPEYDE